MSNLNLWTSRTVIGAIIAALGKLLEVPELEEWRPFLEGLALILQGVGGIIFAIGVRSAIAKSAQGVIQSHPVVVAFAIAAAVWAMPLTMLSQGPNAPPTRNPIGAYSLADSYQPGALAGDSLKIFLFWTQPPDTVAKGKIDSTVYTVRVSVPSNYFSTNVVPANANTRRVKTTLRDSLRIAKPAVGGVADVKVSNFIQCRKGDCSTPGSGAFSYKHTWAPPAAVPTIKYEVF